MLATVSQFLESIKPASVGIALQKILIPLAYTQTSRSLTSAALRIKTGSASPIVQSNAALYALANGILVTKATSTDMAALSGTVANAAFNVFVFYIDQAGTLTSKMGIAGATLAAVKFPHVPDGKAVIGFVVINPTGTGNFVGGTTDLDDATVVPTAAFINTLSGFDPTILP